MKAQRGIALPEVLLGLALAAAFGLCTVAVLGGFARTLAARATSPRGSVSADATIGAMRVEAAGAFAVFVPATDVWGAANASPAHELDFYTKDDAGTEFWWAYAYDAAAQTVQRYDFIPGASGAPAHTGVADRSTGIIDANAHYPALTGVTSFAARTLEAPSLTSTTNRYGSLLRALAPGITPAALPVGFVPASGAQRADLFGGNTIVELTLATGGAARTIHLGAAAPSGFTVHAKPSFRAIVYRKDVGHRFAFGLAQKTWARIYEQIQYSTTPSVQGLSHNGSPGWKVWCDFQLYGAGTDGLDLNDPHATFRPSEWNETAAGAFYYATQGNLKQLNPVGCSQTLPGTTGG